MNAERWREVDTVLKEALEQEPCDRAEFLDRTCAGRSSLRAQVEALIRAFEQGGDFLESPMLGSAIDIENKKASVSLVG